MPNEILNCLSPRALALTLASIPSLLLYSEGVADENTRRDHHWNILAEFVYMRRAEVHNHTLVKDANKPLNPCKMCPTTEVIDCKDLVNRMGFTPGFRAALMYTENPRSSYEVNFLYLHEWEGEKSVHGNASLSFPFSHAGYVVDYSNASEAKAENTMHFWDVELNYWRHFTPRFVDYFSLSGIFGLRYFHWNEGFDLTMTKPPDKSKYTIDTKNDIFGAQAGLDLQVNPTRWLTWDFITKVGLMANHAKMKTVLGDMDNTVKVRNFHKQEWQTGVFAEVAATLGFQFKENVNLHAGYQVLFFSGLALAPEQIAKGTKVNSGDSIYTNGAAIIHGLYAGIIVSF